MRRLPGLLYTAWLSILCLFLAVAPYFPRWPRGAYDGYVDSIAYPWMTVRAGIGSVGFAAPAFHPALGIDGQSLPQGRCG